MADVTRRNIFKLAGGVAVSAAATPVPTYTQGVLGFSPLLSSPGVLKFKASEFSEVKVSNVRIDNVKSFNASPFNYEFADIGMAHSTIRVTANTRELNEVEQQMVEDDIFVEPENWS